LKYGEAYWIYLTEAVTLRLKTGVSAPQVQGMDALAPPATYYGSVQAGVDFTPQAGMTVTAWVNGVECGQGVTQSQGGEVVYTLNVETDGLNTPSCGVPGRTVSFEVEGVSMLTTTPWNNDQVWELDLSAPSARLFLPVVVR